MILTVYNGKVWKDKLSWSLEHNESNNQQVTIDTNKMKYTTDGENWINIGENY